MTKADLVEQVAEAIGPGVTKKDCALVVDGFLNAVKQALSDGENIEIRGFGTSRLGKERLAWHVIQELAKLLKFRRDQFLFLSRQSSLGLGSKEWTK